MATRSRTLLFLQFRNSYSGSHAATLRQQYNQQQQHQSSLLGSSISSQDSYGDNERLGLMDSAETTIELMMLPPKWVDIVDEVDEELERIKGNVQKLDAMHKKHLLPGFDDRIQEERDIERLTDEITQGFTSAQQVFAEQSNASVTQREQEINHISRSIFQLADIFKDLQTMVIDQGTLLDRIDFNVEQTAVHMQDAVYELDEGEKYQKKARNRKIILLLMLIIAGLFIVLIFKPRHRSTPPPALITPSPAQNPATNLDDTLSGTGSNADAADRDNPFL
ncbi:hypothetical protein BGZ52_001649 [Haplosporangium bisporale]|nr:hypothetical protein BGZ52_001649 [Haplosporangium bisporale]